VKEFNTKKKKEMFELLFDFIEQALNNHGCRIGGKKGNFTLTSYDETIKITFTYADIMHFNEQIKPAQELFIQCLRDLPLDDHPEAKILLQDLLQLDKQNRVDRRLLFKLLNVPSKDTRWLKGQDILKNALTIATSSPYLRIYERTGFHWKPISLNFTKL
jgi:hypothetical protein